MNIKGKRKTMAKQNKVITVSLFLVLGLSSLAFSQHGEEISISTYYPSPYGVYRTMRLYPGTRQDPCQDGELYYDNGAANYTAGAYICSAGSWVELGSGGGGGGLWWKEDSAGSNNLTNINTGNVSIGTDAAVADDYKLTVKGNMQLKGGCCSVGELAFASGTAVIRTLNGGAANPWLPGIDTGDILFVPWDGTMNHYALTIKEDGNAVGMGNYTANLAGHQAGRTVLTIIGRNTTEAGAVPDHGVVEIVGGHNETNYGMLGQYSFVARENNGEKRIAAIGGMIEGGIPNDVSGILKFYTRERGAGKYIDEHLPEMMINSAGMVGIGNHTFEGYKKPMFYTENIFNLTCPIQIQGPADTWKEIVWRDTTSNDEWKWGMADAAGSRRFSLFYYNATLNKTYEHITISRNGFVRVGVEGTNPLALGNFHLRGDSTDRVVFYVHNTHDVEGESRGTGIILKGSNGYSWEFATDIGFNGTHNFAVTGGDNQAGEGNVRLYINGTSTNVGIGTENPLAKLSVHGSMHINPGARPANPEKGDIYADSSDHHLYLWNGGWRQLDN